MLYARWRGPFLGALERRYGDVFTLRLVPPFAEHLVVFSRPDHIREIFAADATDLHAGEGNRLLCSVMGERSIMLVDDADHARIRGLLAPAFSGSTVRAYRTSIEAIVKSHLDRWVAGSTVHTLDRMNDLTADVITQVVFGLTDERRRNRLAPRLRRIVTINPIVFFGWKWPWLERFGPWKRFRDNLSEIDALIYSEIARRRADPERQGRPDVLSRLLAAGSDDNPADAPLTDVELRDQLVTVLLAGHETSASALAWAFHELAAATDVQAEACRAARAGDDRYLEAVVKEAMRRRTVIGGAFRRLARDATICGMRLPKGTGITASSLLAHGRRDSFPDATRFRPGRFLDGSVAPNTWVPFGGGARRCLGAGFALMEGTVVLREALTRYTLTLPPGATAERGRIRNVTCVPTGGARIVPIAVAPASSPAPHQDTEYGDGSLGER